MLRRCVSQIINKNKRFGTQIKSQICGFEKNFGRDLKDEKINKQQSRNFILSVQLKYNNMDGASNKKSLITDYEELVKAQKNRELIIDVREQNEINETGKLPGSIHIPMGDVANVLNTLSNEAFHEKYEKPKPTKDTKIILSCRSGKRSGMVQEALQKLGYAKVFNFSGGWLEWEKRQKA